MHEPQPVFRAPAHLVRLANQATETLNAGGINGPRPFRMADLIREAVEAGLPEVLKRRGLGHLLETGQDGAA